MDENVLKEWAKALDKMLGLFHKELIEIVDTEAELSAEIDDKVTRMTKEADRETGFHIKLSKQDLDILDTWFIVYKLLYTPDEDHIKLADKLCLKGDHDDK